MARTARLSHEVDEVRTHERSLLTLHTQDFPRPAAPILQRPEPPDAASIVAARVAEATANVSWLHAARRARLRAQALSDGQADAEQEWQRNWAAYVEAQQAASQHYQDVLQHDRYAVIAQLEQAFADNRFPAACVDAGTESDGNYVSVVVLFESVEIVGERAPARTPTGRATLRKRTKTERNDVYTAVLGSTVLATAKEAFGCAPATQQVRMLVVRRSADQRLEAIYTAQFLRGPTLALNWHELDPAHILATAPGSRLLRKGVTREVAALDLADDPAARALLDALAVQLDEAEPEPVAIGSPSGS